MKKILILFIAFIIVFSSSAQQTNWNLSIGGNQQRNGLSENLGPNNNSPTLLWSGGEETDISSAPVIDGDKLIVSRRLLSNPDYESWIVCYNLYNGAELWKINLPTNAGDDSYGKVSAVKDGIVYATRAWGFDAPAKLIAIDINTGNVLWQSNDNVTEYPTETINFNSEGDIIAGNFDKVLCIDKTNGTTKWEIERDDAWAFDGTSICIYNDKGYYWRMETNTDEVTVGVCNILNGEYLYASPVVSDGAPQTQQNSLMLGADGTVYATRCQDDQSVDFIISFTDNGTELIENWRYPIGMVVYGNHGVGPDNSVYTFSRERKMIRINAETGELMNTTSITFGDETLAVLPCIAIGLDGIIYMTINDFPNNEFFILSPELDIIYNETIDGVDGIALGEEALAVTASGTDIRVYEGRQITEIQSINNNIQIYPNPSNGIFTVTNPQGFKNLVGLEITDITGKIVFYSKIQNFSNSKIDISNQPAGIYFITIKTEVGIYTKKLVLY